MAKSLCLDFDGVIYYEPKETAVPGAIEFIRESIKRFDVSIFSTRSRDPMQIEAMMRFLMANGLTPEELEHVAFPQAKPPAYIFLDDRAINFSGMFPTMEQLDQFRGWQEREIRGVLDGKKT